MYLGLQALYNEVSHLNMVYNNCSSYHEACKRAHRASSYLDPGDSGLHISIWSTTIIVYIIRLASSVHKAPTARCKGLPENHVAMWLRTAVHVCAGEVGMPSNDAC